MFQALLLFFCLFSPYISAIPLSKPYLLIDISTAFIKALKLILRFLQYSRMNRMNYLNMIEDIQCMSPVTSVYLYLDFVVCLCMRFFFQCHGDVFFFVFICVEWSMNLHLLESSSFEDYFEVLHSHICASISYVPRTFS